MTIPPSQDPIRRAEFNAGNTDRVRAEILTTLRRSGCILPDYVVEALVETTLNELLAARRRFGYMVHVFTEAFGEDCTADKLERLEMCVLLHERDADNSVRLPVDIED